MVRTSTIIMEQRQNKCNALKKDSERCSNNKVDEEFCGVHINSYNKNKLMFILDQYRILQKFTLYFDVIERFKQHPNYRDLSILPDTNIRRIDAMTAVKRTVGTLNRQFITGLHQRLLAVSEEDKPAEFLLERRRLYETITRYFQIENEIRNADRIEQQRLRAIILQRIRQELPNIANDAQGVHRSEVVEMVKKSVKSILEIPVPKEYRWSPITVSKTISEILGECKFRTSVATPMIERYLKQDDIYNFGKGIYGKVLDGVWQYIKNSEHKEDLKKILMNELADNVNTCQQGQLTRLCNILSGYLEGVQVTKRSTSEILGDALPHLRNISNVEERIQRANEIFNEHQISQAERNIWLDALID